MAELSSGDGDHHPGSEKPLLSGPLQTPPTPELGMFSGCARRFLSGLLLGLVEEGRDLCFEQETVCWGQVSAELPGRAPLGQKQVALTRCSSRGRGVPHPHPESHWPLSSCSHQFPLSLWPPGLLSLLGHPVPKEFPSHPKMTCSAWGRGVSLRCVPERPVPL